MKSTDHSLSLRGGHAPSPLQGREADHAWQVPNRASPVPPRAAQDSQASRAGPGFRGRLKPAVAVTTDVLGMTYCGAIPGYPIPDLAPVPVHGRGGVSDVV